MWLKVSPFVKMLQNLFQPFLRQTFHFNEVVRTSKPKFEVMDPDEGVLRLTTRSFKHKTQENIGIFCQKKDLFLIFQT